jgi:hypothetical protein
MESEYVIITLEDAVQRAYDLGWNGAWEAQRYILEAIIKDWREHYGENGSVSVAEAILKALDAGRDKAKEMLGNNNLAIERVFMGHSSCTEQ